MSPLPFPRILLLTALAAALTGCAANSQLEQCQSVNRDLRDQLDALQAKSKQSQMELDRMKSDLSVKSSQLNSQGQLAGAERAKLVAERDGALEDLESLKAAHKQLLEEFARSTRSVPIPAEVKNKLKEFAARTPGFEFDGSRGVSKFTADVLFDLGKALLKPNGKKVLDEFAGILASPSASGLNILIVGHTDTQPIVQPETKSKHPTNWHLGAHRAITVESYLESKAVSPTRMGVASYSQYQPVDATVHGKNRRVEIYVVPPPTGGSVR